MGDYEASRRVPCPFTSPPSYIMDESTRQFPLRLYRKSMSPACAVASAIRGWGDGGEVSGGEQVHPPARHRNKLNESHRWEVSVGRSGG